MPRAKVAAGALAVALGACGAQPAPPRAPKHSATTAPAAAPATRAARTVPDTNAALDTLDRLIREYRLTALRPACYAYHDVDGAPPFTFDVREKHGPGCGGSPEVAPRLFTIRWDPATGAVLTDTRPGRQGWPALDTLRPARP